MWEAIQEQEKRAEEQDERAGKHSLQIQTFREKQDERDDIQDRRAPEHPSQIESFRERLRVDSSLGSVADFQTARSEKRNSQTARSERRPSLPK